MLAFGNNLFRKYHFSSNMVLLSLFALIAIFWSAQYSLVLSLILAFLWIMFLITKWPNYKVGPLVFLFLASLVSFYGQRFWYAASIPANIESREFTVQSIKNNYVILKSGHWKILYWVENHPFTLGQKIKIISATTRRIEGAKNNFSFDFADFLRTKYVFYQFEKIDFVAKNTPQNLRFKFFNWFNSQSWHPLIRDLLWRQFYLINIKSRLDNLDWGYLWVFNGLAFSLFSKLINKIRISYLGLKRDKIWNFLQIFVWFSYWYLLGFDLIFLRFLIASIFRTFNVQIGPYQKRIVTLILISCWEPLFLLRLSSWFLIIAYLLWPLRNSRSWYKNIFLGIIIIAPLQIMLNYRINLSGPILILFLGPIFAFIHCLLFLLWWCPILYPLWEILLNVLNLAVSIGESVAFFWNIGHVPLIYYGVYFFSLGYLINNRSNKFILVTCVLAISLILSWNKIILETESVFMLNVGNGNSFVYINKFKNTVMVFDCGSGPGYSSRTMADFLRWKGINHIDYLFISHFHQDHFNGLESLENTVRIKQVITNETHILNWNFRGITIMAWKLKNMEDINDGSLVLLLKTPTANLLFMGDLTKVGEKKLIETTDFSEVIKRNVIHWIQIGHHGSKNSTSFEFLHLVKPHYAFISSGLKNKHQFPDLETINNLQKLGIKIFSTSGNINWKFSLILQRAVSFH